MPSAATRRLYEDQFPSFMSVYDLDPETMVDHDVVTIVDPQIIEVDPSCGNKFQDTTQQRLQPNSLPDPPHRHNDSTSTQTTESADSSPTTTMSTADTASLSDPSPSSSPDSPINRAPLSAFSVPFASVNPSMTVSSLSSLQPSIHTTSHVRPMTSPSPRKPRNMKGLSIQPVSLSSTLVSEPSSPSFIKPKIPAMKRKPSQLSLKTNSSDLNSRQPTLLEVPKSPIIVPQISERRALKHSTSSPHMLSGLKSATFGPVGGMTFPTVLERNESGLSNFLRPTNSGMSFESAIVEEESPIKAQVANRAALDFESFRESENEDLKSPGYPDGPICIYQPNVYLYLEPTAEEASKFDVVINVAREVNNPFKADSQSHKGSSSDDNIPETAIEGHSFEAGFAALANEARQVIESPTTPKAALGPINEPEYIHIPWDHNTDIQTDLMQLCETIERRTKEGKKVLVHCQQGASRSASLIIAYGMYQNPELSVNDAYYAAQARSRWISPNMRLMYCLQDFQKEVAKKKLPPNSAYKARSGRSPTKHHRLTLSADNIDLAPKEPLTAPLPGQEEELERESEASSPARPRGRTTPSFGMPISPGPSSAPSSFNWSEKEDEADPNRFGRFDSNSLLPPNAHTPKSHCGSTQKPPSSLGFPSLKPMGLVPPPNANGTEPPMSPAFPSFQLMSLAPPQEHKDNMPGPPKSPAFPPKMTLAPPPRQNDKIGFRPLELDLPSTSDFGSLEEILKPPPSPGFGAHRFNRSKGLSSGSLELGQSKDNPPNSNLENNLQSAGSIIRSRSQPPRLSSSTHLSLRNRHVTISRADPNDVALMSPRAETMTRNPLHTTHPQPGGFAGMQFVEVPPTPSGGLFSPRQTLFPRDPLHPFGRPPQIADPRSPPTKGETPIVRSIDELL